MSGTLGTTDSGLGTFGLGVGTGATPRHWIPTGMLGTVDSAPGNIEPGIAGGTAHELYAAFALDLVEYASIGGIELNAVFALDLAMPVGMQQDHVLTPSFVLTPTLAVSAQQGQVLTAAFVLAPTLYAAPLQDQALNVAFVLVPQLAEVYTGPGSGLVIGGVTQAQQIAMLREGDEFQVTLPWAGVRGRTGLARVLSRTKDDTGRPTFVLQFIPTTDPSLTQSQVMRPRLVVDTRTNLARRMVNSERTVNKLESQ